MLYACKSLFFISTDCKTPDLMILLLVILNLDLILISNLLIGHCTDVSLVTWHARLQVTLILYRPLCFCHLNVNWIYTTKAVGGQVLIETRYSRSLKLGVMHSKARPLNRQLHNWDG